MAQNSVKEMKPEAHVKVANVKRNLSQERKQVVVTIAKQAASTRQHLTGRFKMN